MDFSYRIHTPRELILSQTWAHDHLLENPGQIRNFIYAKSDRAVLVDVNDLVDSNCHDDLERINGWAILKTLTDNGKKWMMYLDTIKLGPLGDEPCCTRELRRYARFDIGNTDTGDRKIIIICMQVPVHICSRYEGEEFYKMPEECDIPELTFGKFIEMDPCLFVSMFDLEGDLDLMLNSL